MKSKTLFYLFTILFYLVSTGCGVMFGGSRYNAIISVKDHPNAKVSVNGRDLGTGKVNGSYPRNSPLYVKVKEEGCDEKSQTFGNTFRTGNFILSLLMWGIVGVGIDLATGASFKPDHLHDPDIKRLNDKIYLFNVDYSGCPQK